MTTTTGGTVTITEQATTTIPPAGFGFLGMEIQITAPSGTESDPLIIVYEIEAGQIPPGENKDSIVIFKDGLEVPPCTGAPSAIPNPCVLSRVLLGNGNVVITVLTITASGWTFGASDIDGDGLFDGLDSCPNTANPAQIDTDLDGLGNVCDNCPNTANAGQENAVHPGTFAGDHCEDPDADGLFDIDDPCPDNPDCDGDSLGLGDAFGLFLRDGVEVFMGTLPLVACSATAAINDEDPDALGPDWEDDQDVDGSDLFLFAERFGAEFGVSPPVGKKVYLQRFDIYPTAASFHKIDGSDLFVLASYFGDSCP